MVPEQSISILESLRGQSIILPELNAMLDGWPREVNQGLDQLRRDVDEWLDRYNIRILMLKASTDIVLILGLLVQ